MKLQEEIDLDAHYYRDHSQTQYDRAMKLLENVSFNDVTTVLDVGCGDGKITAEIARRAPQAAKIIGVDASPNMIALAKQTFPHIDFRVAKAENLPFRERFDRIVSFSCLHWVRKPNQAINHICNLLTPGGEVLILTYPKESIAYEYPHKALAHYPEYFHFSPYHTALSIQEYAAIFQASGLSLLKFCPENTVCSYDNKQQIRDYIKGWIGCFAPLPEPLREPFLDRVVDISLRYAVDLSNNMINLPYTSLKIHAKKERP